MNNSYAEFTLHEFVKYDQALPLKHRGRTSPRGQDGSKENTKKKGARGRGARGGRGAMDRLTERERRWRN